MLPKSPQTRARYLLFGLFITSALLVIGLCTPLMTLSKLWFFDSSFSVLSGLVDLVQNQQYGLFLLLCLFSLILPLAKLVLLGWLLINHQQQPTKRLRRCLHWVHEYGRWAMLDVFVVAVLLVSVKLGAVASATLHTGFYLFTAAILSTLWLTRQTVSLLEQQVSE